MFIYQNLKTIIHFQKLMTWSYIPNIDRGPYIKYISIYVIEILYIYINYFTLYSNKIWCVFACCVVMVNFISFWNEGGGGLSRALLRPLRAVGLAAAYAEGWRRRWRRKQIMKRIVKISKLRCFYIM